MVATQIGSNAYLSQILSSLMGVPAFLLNILLMDRCGRKPIVCLGSVLCGLMGIAAAFTEGTAQLLLTLIGKIALVDSFLSI